MKERIYPNGEPKPSDHENWLCCWECGLILPKVHAKHETKLKGFIETPDSIFDDKDAIFATHKRSSSHTKSRERINFIKETRQGARRSKDYAEVDLDVRSRLNSGSGKKLISYSSTKDDFQGLIKISKPLIE